MPVFSHPLGSEKWIEVKRKARLIVMVYGPRSSSGSSRLSASPLRTWDIVRRVWAGAILAGIWWNVILTVLLAAQTGQLFYSTSFLPKAESLWPSRKDINICQESKLAVGLQRSTKQAWEIAQNCFTAFISSTKSIVFLYTDQSTLLDD